MTAPFLICLNFALLAAPHTPAGKQDEGSRPGLDIQKLQRQLHQIDHKRLQLDTKAQLEAIQAFAEIGGALQIAASDLGVLVQNTGEFEVRIQAAKALGRIGPSGRLAIPSLMKTLSTNHEPLRAEVISALGAMAPFSQKAIPQLIKFVKDPSPEIRKRAIGSLARFGPAARDAVPVLIEALRDPDKGTSPKEVTVSQYAMSALAQIGPDAKAAATALFEVLKTDAGALRSGALTTLARVIPKDKKLIPYLVQVLRNKESQDLRPSAAYALGMLGPLAVEAVPDLIESLAAKDVKDPATAKRVKSAALYALGEIGPAAEQAVPAVRQLASGADESLRDQAHDTLRLIQGKKK